jgi:hypothetical protein
MADKIQRSFTAGELSPALRSRADLAKYANGLALCENFIVRAQGGVYSRPGLRYVGELGDSSSRGRLIRFSFNVEQTYILVFEDLKVRVIKEGGYIEASAGVPYELATPYTTAQLARLVVTQDADVMTITHPSHDPRNLNRLSETNWTLTVIDYASQVTAPGTLTLAAVGTGPGSYTKTYRYVATAVDTDGVESLVSPENSIATASLTETAGVKITFSAVAGIEYYRIYKEPGSDASVSTGTYGWIGDTKATTFTDFNLAPITSDAPPEDRQPFAGTNNKPATVTYYQQRQVFGNTNLEPQAIFTTQTAIYDSLRTSNPTRSDDAVTFTIKAQQVNEVRHLVPLDSLIVLTSGGEWKTTEGQDQVLTPSTVGVRPQSFNGASWVPPVTINNTALYVQEKGSRVRDLGYEFSSSTYTGNDLSIMSEHLFEGYQIEEMAFAAEPYGILWCVRNDGVLIALTYQREHQVWGWHHHVTDGTIESVNVISEDNRDALYLIVKRTINGADVRYVERMEVRDTSSASAPFCVDSGLSYNGSSATIISGLDHLEGEDVAVLADGNEVTGMTVISGSITLPRAATVVHVGLAYLPVIELLDVDINSSSESIKANEISVSRVTIEVEKSRGGFVGPKLDGGLTGEMIEIKPRFQSDGYETIELKTFKQSVDIVPGWSQGGGVRIEQRSPLPLTILSVIPKIDVS